MCQRFLIMNCVGTKKNVKISLKRGVKNVKSNTNDKTNEEMIVLMFKTIPLLRFGAKIMNSEKKPVISRYVTLYTRGRNSTRC